MPSWLWPRVGFQIEEEDEVLPITSYSCQWNVPKKRKESTLSHQACVWKGEKTFTETN